jgi:3-methyladenine DNA glycosylase/8-oxoguanine DNA glycosylase
MTDSLPCPFDHKAAIEHLSKADRRLARLIGHLSGRAIEFRLNIEDEQTPYESLLQAIVYQSISGKVAKVIFGRIKALGANGRCPTPAELLRVRKPTLRKIGLSFAKIAAVKDLARKTIGGVVPTLEEAHNMSDQALVDRLISVRGIGAWTVEMFLIFRLGRPDVLPIHDYGVQKGFAITYRKKAIPNRANSPNLANAGAPIARWQAGTCGVPSSTPAPPPAK